MAKKVYVGANTTYTPVEYIESHGTEYIDTEIVATDTTKVVAEYQFLEKSTSSTFCSFGAGAGFDSARFSAECGETYFRIMIGTVVGYSSLASDLNKHTFTLDAYNKTWAIDTTTGSASYTTLNSQTGFTFFGVNRGGAIVFQHSGRFYSAQIYESGTLTHDLIPVVDGDGVALIYDKETGVVYGNKGTGTLTAGSATGDPAITDGSRNVKKIYVGSPTENLTNLILNGSLKYSTGGWSPNSNVSLYSEPNYTRYVCNTANTGTYAALQFYTGVSGSTLGTKQILYVQAKVKGKSTNTSYPRLYVSGYQNGSSDLSHYDVPSIDGKTGTELNDEEWHTLSRTLKTVSDDETNYWEFVRIAFGTYVATVGDEMCIKDVVLVNLTAEYGRGTEPTKEWCDANIGFGYDQPIAHADTSTARSVFRAYVGVNGVAKCFWNNKFNAVISKVSSVTSLSSARYFLAAARTASYGIFAGGTTNHQSSSTNLGTVNAYNTSLTRSTPTSLRTAKYRIAAASIGGYALFAGGSTYTAYNGQVDAYDNTLTRSTPTGLSISRHWAGGATIGTSYAIFAGGHQSGSPAYCGNADAYTTTLVHSNPTSLSTGREMYMGAGSVGNNAVFCGGNTSASANTNIVEAYGTGTTKLTNPAVLSNSGFAFAAGTDKYLFVGLINTGIKNLYDANLVKLNLLPTNMYNTNYAGAGLNGAVLFGGGGEASSDSNANTKVTAIDNNLKYMSPSDLSVARGCLAATTVGNYVLFGGGGYKSNAKNAVDAYQVT